MKDIREMNVDNINYLTKNYDMTQGNYMIGLDILNEGGVDMVLYDISEMLQTPYDYDDFKSIISENALDEEEFEVDRVCLMY